MGLGGEAPHTCQISTADGSRNVHVLTTLPLWKESTLNFEWEAGDIQGHSEFSSEEKNTSASIRIWMLAIQSAIGHYTNWAIIVFGCCYGGNYNNKIKYTVRKIIWMKTGAMKILCPRQWTVSNAFCFMNLMCLQQQQRCNFTFITSYDDIPVAL